MEGKINLLIEFLQIECILDDKLDGSARLYLVRWKNLNYTSWVNIETISSLNVLLQYYIELISGIDVKYPTLSVTEKINELFILISETTKSEIDTIVKSYLTHEGLRLPPSKCNVLTEELIYFIKNHSRPSLTHMRDLRRKIILEKILNLRRHQLNVLRKTEHEINLIADNKKPITIDNQVDLEILPEHFVYVNKYVPGIGVSIPSDPPIGCDCTDHVGCSWSKKKYVGGCCPDISFAEPAYDLNKRVVFKKRQPIYECNKKCTCDENCPNRVVQNGTSVALEIFRTFNECGWGVRTLDDIPKGTFIARYVGEVITYDEAKNRSDEYLFDIDFNYASETDICAYTVDAFKYGNISRFINHSCDPNLSVFGVLIDCLDPDLHEIAFFASRDISSGEELSFNYNKIMTCKCGSINCKLK